MYLFRKITIPVLLSAVILSVTATAAPITCNVEKTRPKRLSKEICLKKCNKQVMGIVFFKSQTEVETKDFDGHCTGTNCSVCKSTPAGHMAYWVWRTEKLPPAQCSDIPCGPVVNGDPHFATWDGTQYSYHGECDLVLADSPGFASGKGLHVHVRTTIKNNWSYISSAAIQIDSDVLEVQEDGSSYFNGKNVNSLPYEIGGFSLRKTVTCKDKKDATKEDTADCMRVKTVYTIDLGPETSVIKIGVFKGFLSVELLTQFDDAVGMMGSPATEKKGMVARDGETVFTDPNAMGTEWQVSSNEPLLFQIARAPQYPAACILPDRNAKRGIQQSAAVSRRRLGADRALQREAEKACDGVPDGQHNSCVYDVTQTGDIDMALPYLGD